MVLKFVRRMQKPQLQFAYFSIGTLFKDLAFYPNYLPRTESIDIGNGSGVDSQ